METVEPLTLELQTPHSSALEDLDSFLLGLEPFFSECLTHLREEETDKRIQAVKTLKQKYAEIKTKPISKTVMENISRHLIQHSILETLVELIYSHDSKVLRHESYCFILDLLSIYIPLLSTPLMDTIEILRALTKHPEQTISHHAFIALQLSCTRLLEDNDMESLLGSNIVEAICDQIQSLVPGPTRNSAFALIETICIKMDNLSEEDSWSMWIPPHTQLIMKEHAAELISQTLVQIVRRKPSPDVENDSNGPIVKLPKRSSAVSMFEFQNEDIKTEMLTATRLLLTYFEDSIHSRQTKPKSKHKHNSTLLSPPVHSNTLLSSESSKRIRTESNDQTNITSDTPLTPHLPFTVIQLNSQVILDEDTTRAKERVRTLKHTTREQREKLEKILKQKEHQEQQAQKYIAILSHLEAEQLTLDHPDICQSPHANPTSTSSPKTTERSLIPTQIESARSTELPSPVKANVKITLPNDLTRIPWMPFDSSTYHFENNRVSKMHRTHGCLVSSVFMKGLYVFYLRFESISGQFVLGIIDPCEVEDAKTKNFGDMTTGIGYSLATTFTVRNQKYVTGGHEKFVPGDEISLIVDTRNRDDDKRIMAITRNGVVQSTALSSLPAQFSLVLSMGKRGTTATIHGMRRGKDTIKGYENIRDGTES